MQVVPREASRPVGEAMLLLPMKCGGGVHVLLCVHACMLTAICCFLACLGSYTTGIVDILVLRTSKGQLGMLQVK